MNWSTYFRLRFAEVILTTAYVLIHIGFMVLPPEMRAQVEHIRARMKYPRHWRRHEHRPDLH
jgi:hypothetical protein